jgi:predicted extracellular nuclease
MAIVAGWGAGPARAQSPTVIAGQDFNALSDAAATTTDSLPSGSSLTNAGSFNSGGPGLEFQTFWMDTRGETNGPVTVSGDTSDFIGVSSFSGGGAPDVSPGGVAAASGTEHNFQFNDGDGRLELVFAGVDLSGLTGRTVSFRYWINDTGYEANDAFFFTLSDGANTQSFLSYGETELEANASADNGTANWQTATVDLDHLIDGSGFGETITLTLSIDTNAAVETIFVDDLVFSSGDSGEPGGGTRIHAIQGSGSSATPGSYTIEAIVVGVFNGSPGLGGFYVQEEDAEADADPLTAEGLFVASSQAVNLGDLVQISGSVKEDGSSPSFNQADIQPISVSILSSGNPLPAPVGVELPLTEASEWERYEGMRVEIRGAAGQGDLTVTEHFNFDRFGEVLLSAGGSLNGRLEQFTQRSAPDPAGYAAHLADIARRTILIDDGRNGQNLLPVFYARGGTNLSPTNTLRGGDTVAAVTGILGFGFERYRLQPTEPINYVATNPRPTTAPPVGGTVKVASFNVLNFFNGDGQGGGFPTSRGATTFNDFVRQRVKIYQALAGLEADIVGLMEIENDGFGSNSAIAQLVRLLNEGPCFDSPAECASLGVSESGLGSNTYAFVDPGVSQIGTDQIAVGLIYRTSVISASGPAAILDTPASVFQGPGTNRAVLAQTFAVIDPTNPSLGEAFTVAANHFKSKGVSGLTCPTPAADPNCDQGDGQGYWNTRRVEAANAVTAWLATDPTGSSDPDILLIGDLNAYEREDPLTAIKSAGYTNPIVDYSYVFDGQWGSLDYALANGSLSAQVVAATKWHINADEPDALDYSTRFNDPSLYAPDFYRASDHDPLVVGLGLGQTAPSQTRLYLPAIIKGGP